MLQGSGQKKIWMLLRPHRRSLALLLLLGVVASLAEGIGIGLLVPFVRAVAGNEIAGGDGPLGRAFTEVLSALGLAGRPGLLGLAILALVAAKSAIVYGYAVGLASLKGRIGHELRSALFGRLLDLDLAILERESDGQRLNTVAGETWRSTDAVGAFIQIQIRLTTALVLGAFLLLISWRMALIALAVALFASLSLWLIVRGARLLSRRAVAVNGELANGMVDLVTAMRTIRAFAQEPRERLRLEGISERVRRAFLAADRLSLMAQPVTEVIYLGFFVGAILLAPQIEVGIASLLAFLLLLYRLVPHLRDLEQQRVLLASLSGSLEAVFEILERDGPAPAGGSLPFRTLEEGIRFEEVAFEHERRGGSHGFSIRKASFEIGRGELVALVGPSGAGKSTLLALLLGFYRPSQGRILLDGRPLSDYDLASWRRAVGFAGQDAELMVGTVAENIAYGRPAASRAEIEEAARLAGAEEFLRQLPLGYDTPLGRQGAGLSGGQRQRIALARALLVRPQLLILDEATNAVDNIAQAQLQKALASLHGETTILVIAHRMATLRHADSVIAMADGHVVEQGPPEALLARDALFAELYRVEEESFTASRS